MPVTDRHDEIEDWLGAEVHPLAPPPGTFERIQRRARRRKTHQLLVTAAGAVVIIAGAVAGPTIVPHLLAGHRHTNGGGSVSLGAPTPSHTSIAANSTSESAPASSSAPSKITSSAPAGTTGLSAGTSGAAAPPNFQPTSITMISSSIGAVIGQAGTPGQCATVDCTSLAGTSNDGRSWYGISAPITGPPDGATGVGQLRYLDINDAWAYGPQLYTSADGGRTWSLEDTHGLRVTDLETAGSRAFALLAGCQGSGPSYAADCTTFSLYSSAGGTTSFQPVQLMLPGAKRTTVLGTSGGLAGSAMLVLTGGPSGGTGYLLSPTGDVLSGSLTGSPWKYAGKAPCAPGAASADGSPLGAQLAAVSTRLLISCNTGSAGPGSVRTGTGGGSGTQLYESSSGGASWKKLSQAPAGGQATSLAGGSPGQVVLATSKGIDYSPDGTNWQAATITGGAPSGGFRYVGLTSPTDGVAVPANARLGEVYITTDGGQTWNASAI
jgi:hypothetical protein